MSADVGNIKKETLTSANPPEREPLFCKPIVHFLLIIVLGLLAYSNTFHSPFQWDEENYIIDNPLVKDLGFFAAPSRAEGLPVYDGLKSRYIGYLTFALNYRFHGFDVVGYHIVNLAVHLVNGILVYLLVLLTFRTPYFIPPHSPLVKGGMGGGVISSEKAAGDDNPQQRGGTQFTTHYSLFTINSARLIPLAVALLFVAHPIQTEAVTYIFQRLASLVSMFYLLSLVLYIKGRLSAARQSAVSDQRSAVGSPRFLVSSSDSRFPMPGAWFLLSLISAVLAMKTKENAFTLPVVIALYEFLFFSGPLKPRVLRLVPFLLTMLIVPLTIMSSGSTPGEIIGQVKDPVSMGFITPAPADYLLTQFRVIVTYIRLLFLPIGQNLLYDYPLYQSFFRPAVFLSFLFLATLFGGAVYLLYKSRPGMEQPAKSRELSAISYLRLGAFGILWFFITLSVESSVIPIPVLIDEYRVYLPSVGFFLAVVAGGMPLIQRSPGTSPKRVKALIASFLVIILVLLTATYARNSVWKDKVSLWTDVVRKSPRLGMGYDNLGLSLDEAGKREQALEQFRIAMRLAPDVSSPHLNMGYVLNAMGRLDEAILEYQTALQLGPNDWRAHLNLGSAYGKKGLPDKAIEEVRAALKINPNSAAAFNNLANAYRQKGDVDRAIENYLAALKLEPAFAEAHFSLGETYEQKEEVDKAIEQYLSSVRIKPGYVKAHYNLGRVYVKARRLDDAIEHVRVAVRLAPGNSIYLNTLGVLYGQKGLYDDAIEQFEAALRLAPDTEAYRKNLERARQLKDKK